MNSPSRRRTSHAAATPPAGQFAPISVLALRVLADLRRWVAVHWPDRPGIAPVEAMALSTAAITPWHGADELRLAARLRVWTYAFDDYTEQEADTLPQLDRMLASCRAIVHTGARDDSHPLLSALSSCQADLLAHPMFPDLAALWTAKFDRCLRAVRYDWIIGRARTAGEPVTSDVTEYLDHADSVLVWITHFPQLLLHADHELIPLDTFVPALDAAATVIRLANDLGSFGWERTEPNQNNILWYGVTEDWVRDEITARSAALRQRLAAPLAAGRALAIAVVRAIDWAVSFYNLADFRDSTARDVSTPEQSCGDHGCQQRNR